MMLNINLSTQLQAQYERFIKQISALDHRLTLQYGDRYTTIKQKFDGTQEWYKQARSEAERSGVIPLDQQQESARDYFAQAGSKAARQEDAIKQKVKTLWHTVTNR
jgi:hypothetical protein